MGYLRFLLALWAAKLSIPALKISHHNGTDFPGSLAIKICPDFLKRIGKPQHIIAVTGTNGKTTTVNLICDLLTASGKKIMHNREGSNIKTGISTILIKNSTFLGHAKSCDYAVLEIDERSAPVVYPYLTPDYLVITNLFRDSIQRNAHPEYMADMLTKNIPTATKLIVNADDLISNNIAPNNQRVYFGLDRLPTDTIECVNLLNDLCTCPKCAGVLKYEYRHYHHIGKAYCSCGFSSPESTYLATNIDVDHLTVSIVENDTAYPYPLITDSVFNVYNIVAAVALMRELGFAHQQISSNMVSAAIPSTRHSEEIIAGYNVILQMSKANNPLAQSRVLDYIVHRPGKKEIFMMMNKQSEAKHWSENPCWMYDTDFSYLLNDSVSQLICAGPRAKDYYLCMLLNHICMDRVVLERNEESALKLLNLTSGDDIYILHSVDGVNKAHEVKEKLRAILLTKEDNSNAY